ncbi:hypothetical protein [Paenibacillus shirakamiensis]|nr:hypothetical protein [Paenibacillus shirakamiensis]
MGTFDPETRWRDPQLAQMPAMPDRNREAIVLCMDELLFPFCGPDDVLYSRCKMDPGLHEYLNGLGFSFQSWYHFDLLDEQEPLPEPDVFKQCMFRLAVDQDKLLNHSHKVRMAAASTYSGGLLRSEFANSSFRPLDAVHPLDDERIKESSDGVGTTSDSKILSPYAITADTEAYMHAKGPFHPLPSLDTVIHVNSKIYSNRLLARIGETYGGIEANSAVDIETAGNTFLKRGPYLLKDPFGVSGKGNLLIDSEPMQRRIADHLHKQEKKGLRSQFLLEPLLMKKIDFSSHWFIHEEGEKEYISVQRMINHQQNYGGSIKADVAFIRLLENAGYFIVIDKALSILAEDGYHGFVCFDSMILEDGSVISIVEINARKSMGLINAYLDKCWEKHGWLTFLSLGLPEGFEFSKLMQALRRHNLLLTVADGYGVVPLSSNTVMVNEIQARRRIAGGVQNSGIQNRRGMAKGRLYVSVVGRDDEHRSQLVQSLRQILSDLSVKVYN